MSLADAFKHKNNVTTIAERGVKLGRSAMLGVLYDELARFVCRSSYGFFFPLILLCRMEWEDLSGKLGSAFCIESRVATICPALERRAEILHDEVFGSPTFHGSRPEGQGAGAGKGQGGGAPKTKQWQERWCTFCNKQGHTVEFCWAKTRGQSKGQVAEGKGKGKKGDGKVGCRLGARSGNSFVYLCRGSARRPPPVKGSSSARPKRPSLDCASIVVSPGIRRQTAPNHPRSERGSLVVLGRATLSMTARPSCSRKGRSLRL